MGLTDIQRLAEAGFETWTGGTVVDGRNRPAWKRDELIIAKAAPGDWRLLVPFDDGVGYRSTRFKRCVYAIGWADLIEARDL